MQLPVLPRYERGHGHLENRNRDALAQQVDVDPLAGADADLAADHEAHNGGAAAGIEETQRHEVACEEFIRINDLRLEIIILTINGVGGNRDSESADPAGKLDVGLPFLKIEKFFLNVHAVLWKGVRVLGGSASQPDSLSCKEL
jgi:hypothetical protein